MTWEIPKLHHSQLPAIPRLATTPQIYSGVSIEKVVAAILVPANHQGSDRPETKKSSKLREALRESNIPNPVVIAKYTKTISQSIGVMDLMCLFKMPHYSRLLAKSDEFLWGVGKLGYDFL